MGARVGSDKALVGKVTVERQGCGGPARWS